jgi:hypothetical protein
LTLTLPCNRHPGCVSVRASCVEFVLAGLHATDKVSRSEKHGRITYQVR